MTNPAGHTPAAIPPAAPRRARQGACRYTAFSLIEVVLVIVILGVIAAVAIPRLSKGSQGSADAAMARDVQILQKAVDLYAADHDGAFPNGAMVADQLTFYTDTAGSMAKSKAPPYCFGPYLRKVPAVPSGPNKGASNISTSPGLGVGWIYDPAEGTVTANMTAPPNSTSGPT